MGTTEAMGAGIVIVAGPAIMDGATRIRQQNPLSVDAELAALARAAIQSQPLGGIDMEPMQQPFDSPARFIHMVQFLPEQALFDHLYRRTKRVCGSENPVEERAIGKRAAKEIVQQFANALHRQQLVL